MAIVCDCCDLRSSDPDKPAAHTLEHCRAIPSGFCDQLRAKGWIHLCVACSTEVGNVIKNWLEAFNDEIARKAHESLKLRRRCNPELPPTKLEIPTPRKTNP